MLPKSPLSSNPAFERGWPISGFFAARGNLNIRGFGQVWLPASPSILRWAP